MSRLQCHVELSRVRVSAPPPAHLVSQSYDRTSFSRHIVHYHSHWGLSDSTQLSEEANSWVNKAEPTVVKYDLILPIDITVVTVLMHINLNVSVDMIFFHN